MRQPVPGPPPQIIARIPKETPPGEPPGLELPTVPMAEGPGKEPKPRDERDYAPCMPIHPLCGPGFLFR
jgi:hypothetical protein